MIVMFVREGKIILFISVCKSITLKDLNDQLCFLFSLFLIEKNFEYPKRCKRSCFLIIDCCKENVQGLLHVCFVNDYKYHGFRLRIFTMMKNPTHQQQNWNLVLHNSQEQRGHGNKMVDIM